MLPTPPKLPFQDLAAEPVMDASLMPLREGTGDLRPRSRGWRTAR